MKLQSASCLLLAVSGTALGQTIELMDLELGTANGTAVAKSWTEGSVTLNVTTGNGTMEHIGVGQYAGLWFSQNITADGTYSFDFNGQGATYFEIGIDAISGTAGLPVESLTEWMVVGGTPIVDFVNVSGGLMVSGQPNVAALVFVQAVGADNGILRMGISSPTPFTSVSFRHMQNPDQQGSVIEYLRADIVPSPASAAVLGLGGLMATRRRR